MLGERFSLRCVGCPARHPLSLCAQVPSLQFHCLWFVHEGSLKPHSTCFKAELPCPGSSNKDRIGVINGNSRDASRVPCVPPTLLGAVENAGKRTQTMSLRGAQPSRTEEAGADRS